MQRREFLQGGLSIGAGAAWLASYAAAADEPRAPDKQAAAGKPSAPDELNLAVIGIGSQGRALIRAAMLVPGVRFRALCDIWDYARTYGKNFFKTQEQDVAVYEDYREMLEREKGLHAVLIATPDFVHAAQTLACLKAGLHVYCESPMSNAREQSLAMAEAARSVMSFCSPRGVLRTLSAACVGRYTDLLPSYLPAVTCLQWRYDHDQSAAYGDSGCDRSGCLGFRRRGGAGQRRGTGRA
jgi:hypothetical protein